jgi:inosose dehydratase
MVGAMSTAPGIEPGSRLRLALNADTTPLSISDVLMFKSYRTRAEEAAAAGFPATNVDEEEGLDPAEARRFVERLGLEVASGFFHGRFYAEEEEESLLAAAEQKAAFARALGQTAIFCSALVSPPERHAIAGRVRPGEPISLDDRQFAQMARVLESIARIWRRDDITLCYHPHVATYVEAPHEIERLLESTDPALVRRGPDTGHLYFGGSDPLEFIERHFARMSGLHLKDVRTDVAEEARRSKLDYRQANALGIWTELGTGAIDFPALFRMLRERAWSGWVIVETDHTRLPTALDSSRASRRYLKETIGI